MPSKVTSLNRVRVGEIWRYPVKSLHGEMLSSADVELDGLVGDRVLHVRDNRGVLTGRTHRRLLSLRATTGEADPLVQGHPWYDPEAAELVRAAAGPDARLAAYQGPERYDVLPMLVATDAEVARLDIDRRRLRPTLLLTGTQPQEERSWPGHALHIGPELVLGVDSVRLRCIVTTVDPDTAEPDREVLRRIHRDFASRVALNCWVITPGTLTLGDAVAITPLPQAADRDPYLTRPTSWIAGGNYPA